jgi:hypothetical protein
MKLYQNYTEINYVDVDIDELNKVTRMLDLDYEDENITLLTHDISKGMHVIIPRSGEVVSFDENKSYVVISVAYMTNLGIIYVYVQSYKNYIAKMKGEK